MRSRERRQKHKGLRDRSIIWGTGLWGKKTAGQRKKGKSKRHHTEIYFLKKRLPPPSRVMAMSHQLWMSGRPHGPHRWENQGPGQRGPAIWVLCPGGGECDGATVLAAPPPLCPLLSAILTVMCSEVWGPDWHMSWLKTNCPLCFWPFWVHASSWLSNVCVKDDCGVAGSVFLLKWYNQH